MMEKITKNKKSKLNTWTITDVLLAVMLLFVIAISLYPFWYIIVRSLNDADDLALGGVYLFPRKFSLESYKVVLKIGLLQPLIVSVARVVVGIITSIFMSSMLAYVLSHRNLIARKFFNKFFTYTMYFSAGLIPTYLMIKDLHLMNTFWVYIFPVLISVYNVILLRVYYEGVAPAMEESAKIDGANEVIVFFKIMLPLSLPIIAALSIFTGVSQWNSWQDAYLYNTNNEALWPLQMVLMNILNESSSMKIKTAADIATAGTKVKVSSESIQLAITAITTVPIIIIYPFFQKYFVHGVMVGAVKE